ncbi:glycerol 3-phosphate dehydrogenase [Patella vulgata]|uniref:glycerol 3-phosphate dehydrogenase n=1 Tax=Patella vulgata TaxID=6465 RepID=UPI00217FDE58|nr:glycerol 3-phosphate dehydrogenase [Patella vulgata]
MADDLDVIIIGGGVVGCATLFELTNCGYKCLLLDKNKDVLSEASSGNSGMLHTGFDAELNSVESYCIKICQEKVFSLLKNLGLPYKQIGATMVAWTQQQKVKLDRVYKGSIEKGIDDVFQLSASDVYQREGHLHSGLVGGLWIPKETVLDPWLFPLSLLQHSIEGIGMVKTGCEMFGFSHLYHNSCELQTSHGPITAKAVVNCSGLHGDLVDKMAGCQSFRIYPRKGQFTVYGKNTAHLVNSSILPVPTEKTKGVIVFKTVYGNIIVGPTAEDTESRSVPPDIDSVITSRLFTHTKKTVPGLSQYFPLGHYTGLRPATQYKDYQIKAYRDRNWISVGGIRSTGLSGCLGIASMVNTELCHSLNIEPSYGPVKSIDPMEWSFKGNNSVQMNQNVYDFTHPITKFGTQYRSGL